jgi:alkylhydroperoxidase family enzyme
VLNRAWYEWEHHAPILIKDGQLPSSGLNAIFSQAPGTWSSVTDADEQKKLGLDEKHLAVLEYTDAMTLTVEVPDETFAKVRGLFSERELVEITTTVGAYNTVSRFLVALDVGERLGENGKKEVIRITGGGVSEDAVPAPRSY